ncbi:MAG: hypothetical protein RRZ68_08520, partial [Oscillospiraceae bacterium]
NELAASGVTVSNVMRYRFIDFVSVQDGSTFIMKNFGDDAVGATNLCFIPLEDYNLLENKSAVLAPGEALLYSSGGEVPGETIDLGVMKLK